MTDEKLLQLWRAMPSEGTMDEHIVRFGRSVLRFLFRHCEGTMKIPMTDDRLYVAARVLCELRGIAPADMILSYTKPNAATWNHDDAQLMKYRPAIEIAKEEIGLFVQALTAMEHAYELLPLGDDEKVTS